MRLGKTLLATVTVGLGLFVSVPAMANSVSMNTGTANWRFVSAPPSDVAAVAAQGSAAQLTYNGGWISAGSVGNGTASWVGPTATSNAYGAAGDYLYSLDFTVASPGAVTFNGWYSSDNVVKSIYVDSTSNTLFSYGGILDQPPGIAQFLGAVNFVPAGLPLSSPPVTHTLFVVVHNELARNLEPPAGNPSGTNPTGFIMQGTIQTPVPLPAAAWMGMAMIGGIGALRAMRRKAEL